MKSLNLVLTNKEIELLRNAISDLGKDKSAISLQLKVENAVSDAKDIKSERRYI